MSTTKAPAKELKVTVIGGGTGTSVVLTGLKQFPLELNSIVTVADSGGSTGRLRDEFGFAPVGDLRQAIAALAKGDDQTWIRDVLLYRFDKGSGLEGHNLGNLILTALQDITGSTAKAVNVASHIFRVKGNIYPITSKKIQLVIEYEDGTVEIGEHILDETKHGGDKIIQVRTSPRAHIFSKAKEVIEQSDYIIIGPGDLYGSLIPNFIIQGTSRAINNSNAKIIYVLNLMTRHSQTHDLTALNHIQLIEKYLNKPIDIVIVNNQPIPKNITDKYAKQNEHPVKDDISNSRSHQVIRSQLLHRAIVKTTKNDTIPRSYLRHHSDKLAQVIWKIIKTY